MSNATKPPAKIGTQGTAGMLATARTHGKQEQQDRQQQHVRKKQQKRQQHQ